MEIAFDAPHVLQAGSSPVDSGARVLRATKRELDKVTRCRIYRNAPTQVSWVLPDCFYVGSDDERNSRVAHILFGGLTALNVLWLLGGDDLYDQDGPSWPSLYESPVYYKRTEVWDTNCALYKKRGFGDCKTLACALAAERMLAGLYCQPVFRFDVARSGPAQMVYHVLCFSEIPGHGDDWEDPSKVKGMGDNEFAYFSSPGAMVASGLS